MTSLHHDDGIEILATSTTMTSGVCATSRMIDIGLTLVSATTFGDLETTLSDLETNDLKQRR